MRACTSPRPHKHGVAWLLAACCLQQCLHGGRSSRHPSACVRACHRIASPLHVLPGLTRALLVLCPRGCAGFRWGSKLSNKMFVGRKYVVKHIRAKHEDKLLVEKERVGGAEGDRSVPHACMHAWALGREASAGTPAGPS